MDGGKNQGVESLAKHFALALSVVCFESLVRCHSFEGVLHFDCDVVVVPDDDRGFGGAAAGCIGRWARAFVA